MSGFRVEPYANVGTGEPWVARTVVGFRELTFGVPAFATTREAFMQEVADGVFSSLGKAFETLRGLRTLTADERTPVLTLVASYQNLYGELWRAHKGRFQKAMKALGLDIGFLYKSDSRFEADAASLLATHAELGDLVALMRRDRADFQLRLAEYRNDVEHPSSHPDPKLVRDFHRLDSAEKTFENVWHAIEDYVVLYVIASLPPTIQVVEIPEEQRNATCPTRYRFSISANPG